MDLPKGFRDIPPEEAEKQEYIITSLREVFKSYGFLPLDTPAVEMAEVLSRKAGEEIAGQMFKVEDEYALRYDLTVPLARYVSSTSIPLPFKRYQIDKAWRKEEPQKNRYREFIQADADIVGSSSIRCEIELLNMASRALEKLGLEGEIAINSRKLVNSLLLDFGEEEKAEAMRILDKVDKVGKDAVGSMLSEKFGEKGAKLFSSLSGDSSLENFAKFDEEAAKELKEILSFCPPIVKFDPFLVRGLAYYTGPVFEIRAQGVTIGGGGRYDGLVSLFGPSQPAVGISFGISRITNLIKEVPKKKKVYVVVFEGLYKEAFEIAERVRAKCNCIVDIDLMERKIGKQMEYADAMGFDIILIVGKDELSRGVVRVKSMKDGKEREVKNSEVEDDVRNTCDLH
ncbi:MAG: histidine--tRNA ligase [Candidatus Anstonellales archaeon]